VDEPARATLNRASERSLANASAERFASDNIRADLRGA
jgi:hypothetical protein